MQHSCCWSWSSSRREGGSRVCPAAGPHAGSRLKPQGLPQPPRLLPRLRLPPPSCWQRRSARRSSRQPGRQPRPPSGSARKNSSASGLLCRQERRMRLPQARLRWQSQLLSRQRMHQWQLQVPPRQLWPDQSRQSSSPPPSAQLRPPHLLLLLAASRAAARSRARRRSTREERRRRQRSHTCRQPLEALVPPPPGELKGHQQESQHQRLETAAVPMTALSWRSCCSNWGCRQHGRAPLPLPSKIAHACAQRRVCWQPTSPPLPFLSACPAAWMARQAAAGQPPCSPLTNLPLANLVLLPSVTMRSLVLVLHAAGLLE